MNLKCPLESQIIPTYLASSRITNNQKSPVRQHVTEVALPEPLLDSDEHNVVQVETLHICLSLSQAYLHKCRLE